MDMVFFSTRPQAVEQHLQLDAIDTPGVEDSKGEDDDNMVKIIDAVVELGSLAGIIMVSKCGSPITPTWQAQVNRYFNQFPMLASQWVFVHTNADPYARNNLQRRKTSSFEASMKQRIALVQEAMAQVSGDTSFEAAHIFIEADVEQDVGGGPLKAYLAREQNALFSVISNFSTVTIAELPFHKGPKVLRMNGMLLGSMNATIKATQATLKDLSSTQAELLEMKEKHNSATASKRQEIQDIKLQLGEMDNNNAVDAFAVVQDVWHFFSYARAHASVRSRHANYTLSIVDQSEDSSTSKNSIKIEKKTNTVHQDGTETVEVDLVNACVWKPLSVKVLLASKMRDVHSEKIAELHALLLPKQEELSRIQDDHRKAEAILEKNSGSIKTVQARYEASRAMADFIDSKWSCFTYRHMRPFYEAEGHKEVMDTESIKHFQFLMETGGLFPEGVEPVKF